MFFFSGKNYWIWSGDGFTTVTCSMETNGFSIDPLTSQQVFFYISLEMNHSNKSIYLCVCFSFQYNHTFFFFTSILCEFYAKSWVRCRRNLELTGQKKNLMSWDPIFRSNSMLSNCGYHCQQNEKKKLEQNCTFVRTVYVLKRLFSICFSPPSIIVSSAITLMWSEKKIERNYMCV